MAMNRIVIILMSFLLNFLLVQAVTAAEYDFSVSWEGVGTLSTGLIFYEVQ
jgi:hypothetical protein